MSGTKYDQLLDAEVLAFIARTTSCYPKRSAPPDLQEMRSDYEQMCAAFAVPYPAGLTTKDDMIEPIADSSDTIPVRWYYPADIKQGQPAILYFHGGGFVVGSLASHDSICADLAAGAEMDLMAVDYALAPEHRYPAALEDALAATRYFCDAFPGRAFLLAGDSAGAWLAASVAHRLAGKQPGLLGQLLIYPTLGGDVTRGSYIEHGNAPLLSRENILWYSQQFWGYSQQFRDTDQQFRDTDQPDKQPGPLSETEFSCLPPTVIFSARCDPLCDDGPAYAKLIIQAGGKAHCSIEEGLVHGYLRGRYSSEKIANSFLGMQAACRALKAEDWPY